MVDGGCGMESEAVPRRVFLGCGSSFSTRSCLQNETRRMALLWETRGRGVSTKLGGLGCPQPRRCHGPLVFLAQAAYCYKEAMWGPSALRWTVLVALLAVQVAAYTELPYASLQRLRSVGLGNRLSLNSSDEANHLAHFNRTRIPGTEGSLYVREYIKSHFAEISEASGAKWSVEEDVFEARGFNFSNIVATLTPEGSRRTTYMVLSVHYDSKIEPEGFIGAIDSAASCGILLDLAEKLSPSLANAFASEELDLDMGLKIVFFDGEEAIEAWTDEDSIYGARHLHSRWEENRELSFVDILVLLDLLGAEDVNYVPSYFPQTHPAYTELAGLERRLSQVEEELFSEHFLATPSPSFEREYYGTIGDDHMPFLRSGVPVLHMITSRFPRVWHTPLDDFHHVSIAAVHHWNMLFAAFTLEYLDAPLL